MSKDELKNKVAALAKDGVLNCAQALKLANEADVAPQVVGEAANEAKIKIRNCQLGCFK